MTPGGYETAVRARYDELAPAYVERFADTSTAHPLDRAVFVAFASLVSAIPGRVADLGCGPGHWTRYLHDLGVDVFGVDLTPAFVVEARGKNPDLLFVEGSIARLDVEDGSLAGVVAWFSLIHAPPDELPGLVSEIARVLGPGGTALIGFMPADAGTTEVQAYDHTVAAGYRWPVDLLSALLGEVGLVETVRIVREPAASERVRAGCLIVVKGE